MALLIYAYILFKMCKNVHTVSYSAYFDFGPLVVRLSLMRKSILIDYEIVHVCWCSFDLPIDLKEL